MTDGPLTAVTPISLLPSDDKISLLTSVHSRTGIAVPGSSNDWGYWASSLGRWLHQPRGKILGGSTAVNALYVVRASAEEHDAWASLNPNATTDWTWNGLYPYMLKSENFTDPINPAAISTTINDTYHGHSGPVDVSFPQFVYSSAAAWTPTMAALGLKTTDPQGGEGWGGFITPNSINPADGTRSYSKTAYLDPASGRSNLVVLLQSQAVKITWDTSGSAPRATGVDFAQTSGGQTYHVEVMSEVILSAGVFGTPQLLQLSGVGPRALLDSFGITTVVDLPGVGEHFQDHVLTSVVWSTQGGVVTGDLLVQNATFAAQQLQLFHAGALSQSLMSAPNNGIGYVSLKQLFNNDTYTAEFVQQMRDNMTAVVNNQGFTDPTLQAGYELTYQTEVNTLANTQVGAIELLLSSFGSWNSVNTTISIQASLQHPMSRGSVKINSTDPFATPVITANYLNTDSDWAILRAGLRCPSFHSFFSFSLLTGYFRYSPNCLNAADAKSDLRRAATWPPSTDRCGFRRVYVLNRRVRTTSALLLHFLILFLFYFKFFFGQQHPVPPFIYCFHAPTRKGRCRRPNFESVRNDGSAGG